MPSVRTHRLWVFLIVAAVLVVRSPALLNTGGDYDEGLYFLGARSLLEGHLPYIAVWDTKPPLFFALLAGFAKLFGLSIATFRFAADIAVIAAALGLYRIGLMFSENGRLIGFAAALTYAAMTTSDSGLSTEGEIIFAPFVIWAAVLLFDSFASNQRIGAARAFGFAVLLSAAAQIKVTAGGDAAFFLLLALFCARPGLKQIAAGAAGAALPIVAGIVPYVITGTLPYYLDANLWVLGRRMGTGTGYHADWPLFRQELEAYFPACLLAPTLAWTARRQPVANDRQLTLFIAGWLAVDLAVQLIVREFSFQSIPAMAPLSLLGALAVALLVRKGNASRWAIGVALLALVAHSAGQFVQWGSAAVHRIAGPDRMYGDNTAKLGSYLASHRGTGAWLYVATDAPVLYLLAGAPTPTRYPLPESLINPNNGAGVDRAREIRRIFERKPRFVVYRGSLNASANPSVNVIVENVRAHYRRAYAVGDRIIYERR